tara:strand:- start:236 stop:490 length:255 start_codon:yes stop_codon:yes gene_type:complete
MSEENPMTLIDHLCELIFHQCEFENENQLKQFIKELKNQLLELYDPNYETETSESDEEYSDKEVVEEEVKIKKDKEEFYEIVIN